MKVGDIVRVSKYHSLRPGQGKFFKKQCVNKKVVAIEGDEFAIIVNDRYEGKIRLWQKKSNLCKFK